MKRTVALSYWGLTNPSVFAFLSARTLLLPLEAYHRQLPEHGTIVDVGCGHGIVAQYLALRSSDRRVIGYDFDSLRIAVASTAAKDIRNLEFRPRGFSASESHDVDAVVLNGVLCLMPDDTALAILREARLALKTGGVLLLSDIEHAPDSVLYRFHVWREQRLANVGFTKGAGVYVRSVSEWRALLHSAGFDGWESFRAPVALHSTFDWRCW